VISARTQDPATATAADVARSASRKLLLGDDLLTAVASAVRPVLEARDALIRALEAELKRNAGP